ncbi:hypothetical protein HO173_010579 [Letharia columbiana]|uniref:Small ribosomal subunit protein mS38 n=1 Tax=Letharia columbiana TaxID=112416 RepID=A0A8H6FMG4_9LECA|nr:uncharacterized protein HO173_010579 [Letharia columbiana]KAF6231247.1 hypothetical protein HO173_010579 [Letharia columbiana]
MLSLYSSEFVRRSTWTCLSCSALSRTSQTLIASPPNRLPAHDHQRKHSSSKTPSAPKDETRAITTPSEAPSKDAKAAVKEGTEKRPNTRISKRKSKDSIQDTAGKSSNELTFNLPSVPTTNHLHAVDVHMSNFFSLHRPISVTMPIPPESSAAAFSSIFDPKPIPKHKPTNVIYTLSSAVNTLENAASSTQNQNSQPMTKEEVDLRAAVTQASHSNAHPSPHHLDLPAKTFHLNLQELVKNFRPYMRPLPPRSDGLCSPPKEPHGRLLSKPNSNPKNTYRSGRKSYESHTTPIVEGPSSSAGEREKEVYLPPAPRGQPFLGRMRERQLQYMDRLGDGEIWQVISVKRQRKLKMKKHKYKKLMKRTKNLRRRLDRT